MTDKPQTLERLAERIILEALELGGEHRANPEKLLELLREHEGSASPTAGPRDKELAAYIVRFLRVRNGRELDAAFGAMRLEDFERLLAELAHVLHHLGHPPNWVPLEDVAR